MLNVALMEPEIPPNTGNIIRLCANTGAALHLVEPLGFELDDRRLRRAGLDYHEWAPVRRHASLEALTRTVPHKRLLAVTTRGSRLYTDIAWAPDDLVLFGPETRGLPDRVLDKVPDGHRIRIPMRSGIRSLNLSNAVAVLVYEAWRQQGFAGSADTGEIS